MTKFLKWYREVGLPAALLASLIIGAGIFALPFVFYRAGFVLGLVYLAVFASAFVVVHKMYADVIHGTSGRHRFVGYAKIYFGKLGFAGATLTTVIGFTLTLVAYIALAKDFIELIAPGLGETYATYSFWMMGSTALIFSLKRLEKMEVLILFAMGLIILTLFVSGILFGKVSNITPVDFTSVFIPYGIILFSLSGRAAISSIVDYFDSKKYSKKQLMRSIALGTIGPAVVYFLFVLAVLFLSGSGVSEDSLSGLSSAPPLLTFFIGTLGVLALLTSYFFLSIEVGDILKYDFKLKKPLPALIVIATPMLLYVSGLRDFIWLVALIGGVFLALENIITISMYSKINGWRLVAKTLVGIFVIGALAEIFYVVYR